MEGELLFNLELHAAELANSEHLHIWVLLVRTLEVEETTAGN